MYKSIYYTEAKFAKSTANTKPKVDGFVTGFCGKTSKMPSKKPNLPIYPGYSQ